MLPSPAYLHVLLNHVPLTGLAVASLGLLFSLALRNATAQVCALALVLICAAAAWPVYLTGKAAYRDVRRIADEPGMDYLDDHLDRADRFTIAYLPATLLAVAGLVLPRFWPGIRPLLGWLTLAGAMAALAAGIYIGEAGGRVRHSEFRSPTNAAAEP
ncbi:MAG: hypothetical protein JO069_14695 [Verrucomicrobia bacterium]|nr:hypothetical protein [Verrucomicrobiota bacterium]